MFDKYTEKYAPKDGKTYCNVFATLATAELGSKVPQQLANHQQEWLLKEGKDEGWQEVSAEEAQKLANQGRFVVHEGLCVFELQTQKVCEVREDVNNGSRLEA